MLQDVMIMQQAKYNLRKSSILTQAEDLPIRRRNLSLGSNPESQAHQSPLSPNRVNPASEIVYTSRKNRSFLKASKYKMTKLLAENTRLCQQNIMQYHRLKQKVKQNTKMLDDGLSPKKLQNTPKLSIKNLGMAVQHQFVSKNRSYMQRRHLQTQPAKQLPQNKSIRNELIPIKIPVSVKKHSERYSIQLPIKKYNQLTLRQIAQVEEGPKFNILIKLRQLKNKQVSKRSSRRPSDDYSLEGW